MEKNERNNSSELMKVEQPVQSWWEATCLQTVVADGLLKVCLRQ